MKYDLIIHRLVKIFKYYLYSMPKKTKPKAKVSKKKTRVGRPSMEIKKKPFQVMLDPRYIELFRKAAKTKNIQVQDFARMALNGLVHDPYNYLAEFVKPQAATKKAKK